MINKDINVIEVAAFLHNKYPNLRPYSLADTTVNKRQIHYWEERGVLMKEHVLNKTRKFSFKELVWLRMVSKLRKMTISFETIREIKNELVSGVKLAEFLNHKDSEIYIDLVLANMELTAYEKKEIKQNSKDVEQYKDYTISQFDIMLSQLLHNKNRVSLIIALKEGQEGEELQRSDSQVWLTYFIPELLVELSGTADYLKIFTSDYISLSLNDVLKDVIMNVSYKNLPDGFFELSKEEKKIMDFIRSGHYTNVSVRFDDNKKPYLAELSEVKKTKMESRLYEIINKGDYQDIEIKTQNGIIYSCKSTRKIKL